MLGLRGIEHIRGYCWPRLGVLARAQRVGNVASEDTAGLSLAQRRTTFTTYGYSDFTSSSTREIKIQAHAVISILLIITSEICASHIQLGEPGHPTNFTISTTDENTTRWTGIRQPTPWAFIL